ncbi:MAG: hypothetical protein LBV26_01075 [Bacteroidales bacterium]|nr:hypothetical protein [Bacteroidales bacterium]
MSRELRISRHTVDHVLNAYESAIHLVSTINLSSYSRTKKKKCKVFLGRVKNRCKVQVHLYIDACTLHR